MVFYKQDLKDESIYNFIVSNVILSELKDFTYDTILNRLKDIFKDDFNDKIIFQIKACLKRLRDDGFLDTSGSTYHVVNLDV